MSEPGPRLARVSPSRSTPRGKPARLTARQAAFVAAYAGNATAAARAAGYTGSPDALATTGSVLLANPKVRLAIQARQPPASLAIASRAQRQAWWTRVMEDEETPLRWRLEASKLLAQSEGDFLAGGTGGAGQVHLHITSPYPARTVEGTATRWGRARPGLTLGSSPAMGREEDPSGGGADAVEAGGEARNSDRGPGTEKESLPVRGVPQESLPVVTEPEDPGLDGTQEEDPDGPVLDSKVLLRARGTREERLQALLDAPLPGAGG